MRQKRFDLLTLSTQIRRFSRLWIFSIVLFSLSACTGSQTPTMPVPVTLVIHDSTVESTATPRPIKTLILPTGTSTALIASATIAPSNEAASQETQVSIPLTPTLIPTLGPQKTSDLLFLSGPRLMRWDHVTNFTTVLAENVIDFSPSFSGDKIAMLRTQKITANGVQLFNLDILDLNKKQIHTLVAYTPPLFQIALSPDGSFIAYLPQDKIGQVIIRSAVQTAVPIKIGDCRPANDFHCGKLLWAPDSRSIAWSDQEGIWLSSTRDYLPRLVIPNQVDILDPENLQQRISVTFGALEWSPVGRFILAQVLPSLEGTRWFGIVDTRDGRLVNIPGSTEFARSCLGALWISNGDLLITHGGNSRENTSPSATWWRILPTRNDLLALADQVALQTVNLPPASVASTFESEYCINWLDNQDDGTYYAHIQAAGMAERSGLYQLDANTGNLQKLLEIPGETGQLIWSPDGSGALVVAQDGQIYFAYINLGKMLVLNDVLGAEVKDFYWLPPMPRN